MERCDFASITHILRNNLLDGNFDNQMEFAEALFASYLEENEVYFDLGLLNKWLKGRTKINLELTGYEDLVKRAEETVKNVVLALFACVLFFGACILSSADITPKMPGGQPLLAAAAMVFSVALGIFTVRRMSKK